MKRAEEWAEHSHLFLNKDEDGYYVVSRELASFIQDVQRDALQAAIEIVRRDGDRHCSYQVADAILQLTVNI